MVRGYMIMNVVAIIVPSAIWIASIQVEYPKRIALIWIAIFIGEKRSPATEIQIYCCLLCSDIFSVLSIVAFKRIAESRNPSFVLRHNAWFDFFPGKPSVEYSRQP